MNEQQRHNLAHCLRCPQRERRCDGACACEADPDRRDIRRHAESGDCPGEFFALPLTLVTPDRGIVPLTVTARPAIQTIGPELWHELHCRPLIADLSGEAEWMERFTMRLPCGQCRNDWRVLLAEMPPDYSSDGAYFAWTVAAHNGVNLKLGKPEMDERVARQTHWHRLGG